MRIKRMIIFMVSLMTVGLIFSTLAATQGSPMSEFKLSSSAFTANSQIPSRYTCDADNVSPPLAWEGVPNGTQSMVLILDDPDAPGGLWDHWLLYNIPSHLFSLTEDIKDLPAGIQVGKNSWGNAKYEGPCPPKGEHRYQFTLYALDSHLNLPNGVDRAQLGKAMKGHILEKTELITRYQRP